MRVVVAVSAALAPDKHSLGGTLSSWCYPISFMFVTSSTSGYCGSLSILNKIYRSIVGKDTWIMHQYKKMCFSKSLDPLY